MNFVININSHSLEGLNHDNELLQLIFNKKQDRFDKENIKSLSINS